MMESLRDTSKKITSDTIQKLGHEIEEIRIRTFKHIEGKISRALLQNELIAFNEGELFRKLILWFGIKPLREEENVLNLMLTILQSSYGYRGIEQIGLSRFKKEIGKIYKIVNSPTSKKLVCDVKDLIETYEERSTRRSAFVSVSESSAPSSSKVSKSSTSEDQQSLKRNSTIDLVSLDETLNEEFPTDYESPWSTPKTVDYNSLKLLLDSLNPDDKFENLNHGFDFLRSAIDDYPSEYFLQPPYIFKALLVIHLKNKQIGNILLETLIVLTTAMKSRLKMRKSVLTFVPESRENKLPRAATQMSITKVCKELFNLCLENLKNFNESRNKVQLYLTFSLLFSTMDLFETLKSDCLFQSTSLLMDFGYMARSFRQSLEINEKQTCLDRLQYLLIIIFLAKLVNYSNKLHCNNGNLATGENQQLIWRIELENALLDYSFQKYFPECYENVKTAINLQGYDKENLLRVILDFEESIRPAFELIRDPHNISNEEIILRGENSLNSLLIHRSTDLVRLLVHTIAKCGPLLDGNIQLKMSSENIILRLLACHNLRIKRAAYKECSNVIKESIGSLMNGETTLNKIYSSKLKRTNTLGIPFTVEILTEIICFGCFHSDNTIRNIAELIISLILRGRSILEDQWENFFEIILPNLSLLQCFTSKFTKLGMEVLSLANPDSNIPSKHIIESNVRLLFLKDAAVRAEALLRVIYIVSYQNQAKELLPNVLEISDTLPQDICILENPKNVDTIFSSGFYDKSIINGLIELLKSDDVEPSVRKSTFLQLNVVCQDSQLLEIVYSRGGAMLVLRALEDALKKDPQIDYTDTVVPLMGILAKMSLCVPEFRRNVSEEGDIFSLIIRALFIFHHDVAAKEDCCIALFLLSFSSHITGSKHISLPKQFLKPFKIPIKCTYYWEGNSPFEQKTLAEKAYVDIFRNIDTCFENNALTSAQSENSNTADYCNVPSLLSYKSDLLRTERFTEDKDQHVEENFFLNGNVQISQDLACQYIRFGFTSIWFRGFENLVSIVNDLKFHNNEYFLNYESSEKSLNFSNGTHQIVEQTPFNFNRNLKLSTLDLVHLKFSSMERNVNHYLDKLKDNPRSKIISAIIARIKLCILVKTSSLSSLPLLSSKEVLQRVLLNEKNLHIILSEITLISPEDKEELAYLHETINCIITFLRIEEIEIDLDSFVEETLEDENCFILQILKTFDYPFRFYEEFCTFFKFLLKTYIRGKKDAENSKEEMKKYRIFSFIFDKIILIIEDGFQKKNIPVVRSLASILRFISSIRALDFDTDLIEKVIKKLLHIVMKLRSFTQAASNILKECFITIINITLDVNELILSPNQIRFLSSLCGHSDFEVRSLSWCILSKLCSCLKGAQIVVKELSFLPGGFHACCVSSFTDSDEVQIVRVIVGEVISNLLTHRDTSNDDSKMNKLHLSVAPLSIEQEPSADNDGFELILNIFTKHQFLFWMLKNLNDFNIHDEVLNIEMKPVVSCDLLRVFSSIMINFIDLRPSVVEKLINNCSINKVFEIIKEVPSCVSESSLNMVGEICNLLMRFICEKTTFLYKTMVQDANLIVALMRVLDIKFYKNLDVEVITNILQVLRLLGNESSAYYEICKFLDSEEGYKVMNLLLEGLKIPNNEDLQISCLKTLCAWIVKGQTGDFDFKVFSEILDSTQIHENLVIAVMKDHFSEQDLPSNKSAEYFKLISFSEKLFYRLVMLYKVHFLGDLESLKRRSLMKILLSESISSLLQTSERARLLAQHFLFLNVLISKLEGVLESLGMLCTEFIRKYGDAKKEPIVHELILTYGILLNWYSVDCLLDEKYIHSLSTVIIKSWPWVSHSKELKLEVFKCLAFLSEDSIPVCKQLSTNISSYSHTILQLVVTTVKSETSKVKHPLIDYSVLEIGLRVISNCCSCIDGRSSLIKLNILDIFDKFHPSITKLTKSWNTITTQWLRFYEVFSRYPEGAQVKHLSLLCTLIAKANFEIRILSLSVIRNMAFLNTNRFALVLSHDFIYTVESILEDEHTDEEKYIVLVTLWKLIADNCKAKSAIKGTQIAKQISRLSKLCSQTEDRQENNFSDILEILMNIL